MKPISLFLHTWIFTVVFITISGCCEKEPEPSHPGDCMFVQNDADMDGLIDNYENMLLNSCLENRLLTKQSIENNLIGDWKLIGHASGWFPTPSLPCAFIQIDADSLIFKYEDEWLDTLSHHAWEIEELASANSFVLQVESGYHAAHTMRVFCPEYMFANGTPYDGNMYLYQKQ